MDDPDTIESAVAAGRTATQQAISRLRPHAGADGVRAALDLLERALELLAPSADDVPLVGDAGGGAPAPSKRTTLQTPIAAAFADPAPTSTAGGTRPVGDATRVDVTLDAIGLSNFYHGVAGTDVARHGGIFVATDTAFEIGALVRVAVTIDEEEPFEILAVVRWTRARAPNAPAGFGASFLEVGERASEAICAFVAARPPFLYGS